MAELTVTPRRDDSLYAFRVREVGVRAGGAVLLVRAMGFFQLACGSFAAATLVALVGAVFGFMELRGFVEAALALSLLCAMVAFGGIVAGSRVAGA